MKRLKKTILAAATVASVIGAAAWGRKSAPPPTAPPPPTGAAVPIPMTQAAWMDVYQVPAPPVGLLQWNAPGIIVAPQVATSTALVPDGSGGTMPKESHAYLLASDATFRNFLLTVHYVFAKQTRLNLAPMPWEVPSVYINFTASGEATATGTWVMLKTNGFQIETLRGDVGEYGLYYSDAPQVKVGDTVEMKVQKVGAALTVWINGAQVFTGSPTWTDANGFSHFIDDVQGSVVLYGEDSEAHWLDATVTPL